MGFTDIQSNVIVPEKPKRIPWNKGLKTPDYIRKKQSASRMGKVPWNKGKSGEYKLGPASNEKIEKIRKSNTGLKRSEETKKRISDSKLGKPSWNKGMTMSLEHRKKLSLAHIGKKLSVETRKKLSDVKRGENGPGWKGGITSENKLFRTRFEAIEWRKLVFERDNYTCQKTGLRGVTLHAHHILNFATHPDIRFDINNGVTLSAESHSEFHRIYGNRYNTREQLEEYLGKEL